jgi:hypothetical protein
MAPPFERQKLAPRVDAREAYIANTGIRSIDRMNNQRAAQADFMRSFDPNTAVQVKPWQEGDRDFRRFKEGLKEQVMGLLGPMQGGVMSSAQKAKFDELYTNPYRGMMEKFKRTNPKSYKGHFPASYYATEAAPGLMAKGIGAMADIPIMGNLMSQFLKPEEKESEVGDYSYLDYKPDRIGEPEGTIMGHDISSGAVEDWYSQNYPLEVPWWFYQFMDDEMLPYKLGRR